MISTIHVSNIRLASLHASLHMNLALKLFFCVVSTRFTPSSPPPPPPPPPYTHE